MSELPEHDKPVPVSFLQRWSRRKRRQHLQTDALPAAQESPAVDLARPAKPVSEQELPPVDSLNENSEVGMFLDEAVSEQLKRQALRRLFHMQKFNICDGLDDYAEDYTSFEPLGEMVTAFQRLQKEREELARKLAGDAEAAPAGQTEEQRSADTTQNPLAQTSTATQPQDANVATEAKPHEV